MARELTDKLPVFLSTLPAGRGERRLALAVVLGSVVVFLAVAPFATVPLAQVWAFLPIYESALVINDLITAVMLFGQFRILRSRALLVLASGYLFTAFIAVSHALTFPGLFSPTGLLGAGPQSTAWLYMFWHSGFPLVVIAYASLTEEGRETAPPRAPVVVLSSIAAVLAAVVGLTLLATAGQDSLPAIMQGHHYTPAMITVVSSVWVLSLLALLVLWRRRPHSVLDLWLMVVMCAWLFDIALAAVLNAGRFDLGFYAGRIYGLLAASFVLLMLLLENSMLYARLVEAHESERRRVNALARTADRFSAGDLSVRTDLTQEPGELGQVARAFDRMAEALGRRQAESERRRREAESLAEVGRVILEFTDPQAIGQRIADRLREMLEASASTLYRLESDSGDLVAVAMTGNQGPTGEAPVRLPKGTGVVGLAVTLGRPITTVDLLTDPRISLTPETRGRLEQASFRAVLAVPLVVQGRVLGALGVGDRAGRTWTPEEAHLAHAFADQAAISLENAQLLQDLKMRQSRLEALLEASQQLARIQPLESLLRRIAESCRDLLHADWVGFRVAQDHELVLSGSAGQTPEEMQADRLQEGRGLSWMVAASGQPLVVRDPGEDPRTPEEQRQALREYRAWLGVPVKVGEQVIGVLNMGTCRAVGFSANDVALATAFASQAAVAIENSRLYQEVQQAYEDLAHTQDQLVQAQKMEAIGQLAGGIAHDFNNLLTVITGRSHLALQGLPEDHPQRRGLELIQRTAERAAALTRQLLAFSRRQVLQSKVLDLNSVVSGIAPMLQRLIGEDIEFDTVAAPDLGRVKTDPSQIEQVIMNLVINARDAMPQGGRLTIESGNVELDEGYARKHAGVTPGRYVLLAVSDTGHGMDAATQVRIFEPFFTTKEKGKGTGLGLATVHGITLQSGGHIGVYSEPGKGATFKIYLPRVEDAVEVTAGGTATPPTRGSETILLVEDDEEVRAIARETLEGSGYAVIAAANAEEALRAVADASRAIHLLVTDVVMPQVSGRELVERLAQAHRDLRVLYISGYTDDAIVRHGVLEEGTAFLQKPFTPGDLLRRVREVLDQRDKDAGSQAETRGARLRETHKRETVAIKGRR